MTLVCIDDIYTELSIEIIEGVTSLISFGDIKLFSSKDLNEVTHKTGPFRSSVDIESFKVGEMYKYIDTEFFLIIEYDGYPLNPSAWTDDFYKYDFIGAPWIFVRGGHNRVGCKQNKPCNKWVGNDGFSFQSSKLLIELSSRIEQFRQSPVFSATDAWVCREINEELKAKGFKFSPVSLASRFSVEKGVYTGQFGWHGEAATRWRNKDWKIFNFERHAYEEGLPPLDSTIKLLDNHSDCEAMSWPGLRPVDFSEYE